MDLSEVRPNIKRHPWELSRADFLLKVLRGHSQLGESAQLLDVGAGDLFFSEKAQTKTGVKIDAVDQAFDNEISRNEAIRKIKHLDEVLHRRYDAICALDVLEHVEDDFDFLNTLVNLLKPGSALLLTVPAFQFLFSEHDRNLRHFRRYTNGQVRNLIQHRGEEVEVVEHFYFFHALFFGRVFEKLKSQFRQNQFKGISDWRFAEHHPFSKSLGGFLSMDATVCRALARMGIRLPGLSLCMVIRKK